MTASSSKKGGGRRGVLAVVERLHDAVTMSDGGAQADGDAPSASKPPGPAPRGLDAELANLPRTDLGNAERFARRYAGQFLHVAEKGWFRWDGRRWARDGAREAVALAAHRVARLIQVEADTIAGTAADYAVEVKGDRPVMLSEKLKAWGRSSEASGKLDAIPKHAAPMLACEAEKLDADPFKITVLNGTLRVRPDAEDEDPIELAPHDPADLITKLSRVEYDPLATCPRYDAFLADAQPAADVRRFIHQWGGLSLTGDVSQQKLVMFIGVGGAGKSTLVDAWGEIAGDYGETVPIETFLDQGRGRSAGGATPDLALLPGVRFLRTSEPEKGAKFAEAFIKLVTGGEPIQARFNFGDFFRFKPEFKLTISGNYRPTINGNDEGIWRRMILVPWTIPVPKERKDARLPEALRREASGILNRLLDGLRDYLSAGPGGSAGLVLPGSIEDATTAYREDSDPLGRFLEAAIAAAPGERVRSSALYDVFAAWARASGERVWSAKGLTLAMKERGFQALRSNGMQWRDIRLTASVFDFEDIPPHPHRDDDDDE